MLTVFFSFSFFFESIYNDSEYTKAYQQLILFVYRHDALRRCVVCLLSLFVCVFYVYREHYVTKLKAMKIQTFASEDKVYESWSNDVAKTAISVCILKPKIETFVITKDY